MPKTLCPLCNGEASIDNNHPILRNTIANLQAISLLAATVALDSMYVEYEIITDGPCENGPTDLVLTWDHEAYDGMGYHVGTEVYTATAHIFDIKDFGTTLRIPPDMDHYIIFFDSFEPKLVSAPTSPDDEDLDGNMDVYSPPDDETVYQLFQSMMQNFWQNLPVAIFDKRTRTWLIGNHEWKVGNPPYEYF